MTRKIALPLVLAATPALGGCVAQAALAAAELSQYIPPPQRANNAQFKPAATQACTRRAAQYGSVFVLDVEQRSDRHVVWGSVTDARQHRRTFECHFTNRLVSFKLREIGARS